MPLSLNSVICSAITWTNVKFSINSFENCSHFCAESYEYGLAHHFDTVYYELLSLFIDQH